MIKSHASEVKRGFYRRGFTREDRSGSAPAIDGLQSEAPTKKLLLATRAMIGAALAENRFHHRGLFAQLTLLLVKHHEVLHARAFVAFGVTVATAESDAATGDGAVNHGRNRSIKLAELRARKALDLTMWQHAGMGADFVGDIITRAREERLIQQRDLHRTLRIAQQSRLEVASGEFGRQQIMPQNRTWVCFTVMGASEINQAPDMPR